MHWGRSVLEAGLRAEVSKRTDLQDSASATGSGDILLLATSVVFLLMEQAAQQAVADSLWPGETRAAMATGRPTTLATTRTFDSFECAIHAVAAPACEHCGCRIIGHGVEADGRMFCCANCAKAGRCRPPHRPRLSPAALPP